MSGYNQYISEIKSSLTGNSKKFEKEIIESINEVLEIEDQNYEKIISILGLPKVFVTEFMSSRIVETESIENPSFINSIRILNYIPFIIIFVFIFIIPFYDNTDIGEKKTTYQLASEYWPINFILGPILILSLFIIMENYQRQILYGSIHNFIQYFKIYRNYLILTFIGYLLSQLVFIQSAYQFAIKNPEYQSWNTRNLCSDFGLGCDSSTSMWNLMQWLLLWMLSIQMLQILVLMFYRLNRNGFSVSKYEQMEAIDLDTMSYPTRISQLYRLIIILIMGIYTPLYAFLVIDQTSTHDWRVFSLMFVDLAITILIIFQFLYFAGLAYSNRKLSSSISIAEYSCTQNWKSQTIYFLYFISTLFPDYSFANTDGFIVGTTLIAVPLVLGMWAIEYRDHTFHILALIPIFYILVFQIA